MKNLGETLKAARDAKGVSVEDASDITKIRTDYIRAMEDGNFDYDLPEIYKRGFLRLYAEYLDLDQSAIMADYNAFASGKNVRESSRTHEVKEQFMREIVSNSELEPSDDMPNERYTKDSSSSSSGASPHGTNFPLGIVLLFAGILVAIAILVFAIISLTKPNNTKIVVPPTETIVVQKVLQLKITALKDSSFKLYEEDFPSTVLFDGILLQGETKEFSSDFTLIFTPRNMQIEDFKIEKNGVILNTSGLQKTENYRLKVPAANK